MNVVVLHMVNVVVAVGKWFEVFDAPFASWLTFIVKTFEVYCTFVTVVMVFELFE